MKTHCIFSLPLVQNEGEEGKGNGMIKGVNKQIVEINYTRDDYIEKAILIVNPSKAAMGRAELTRHAEDYMQKLLGKAKPPSRRFRRRLLLWLALGLLVLAGVLLLIFS